ncbi:hypothetical protein [Algisphaera agarilytica]|uniref:Uncharacterized protein n=1 Tax=Algisphaera agarilytica TaxID=1385975 RepID=A0A7X0H7L9_9BACT|nr:hypothetical protein [Algisphaera agarilytica]MBB6430744.1 hypothetical protein [Algisphaera agarilytica]
MTKGTDLLRLLEPTVRPVSPVKPTGGVAGVKTGELPFEAQDFDTLLASVREGQPVQAIAETTEPAATAAKAPDPLDTLAAFGRIENPGLRELIAQQRQQASPNATTPPHAAA